MTKVRKKINKKDRFNIEMVLYYSQTVSTKSTTKDLPMILLIFCDHGGDVQLKRDGR